MMDRRTFTRRLAAGTAASLLPRLALAQTAIGARNVVLVHGLFADGSCWSEVIARLQAAGINATAVQNPLTTLEAWRRAAGAGAAGWADRLSRTFLFWNDRHRGWCRPKGHGSRLRRGAGAGCGRGLYRPGQDVSDAAGLGGHRLHGDYGRLSEAAFLHDFAGDLPEAKARVLYAVQAPFHKALLAGKTTHAAWRSKPSCYAVSTEDRTINPDLERFMAKRMGANTIEVKASHLSLISHPQEITDLILKAAGRR